MLTRGNGDPIWPTHKSEVLAYVNSFSRAILEGGVSTSPTVLVDEQEVFYITSGTGRLTTGGEIHDLRDGIFFLVPAGVEFTMTASGAEPLTMYLIKEPVSEDFQPGDAVIRPGRDGNRVSTGLHHQSLEQQFEGAV